MPRPRRAPRAVAVAAAAVALLCTALLPAVARAQGAAGGTADTAAAAAAAARSPPPAALCSATTRSYDGSCNNLRNTLWGAAGTAHYEYPRAPRESPAADLPSARHVSNVVCAQREDRLNRRFLSEFTVFFGQFLDHTIVATPVNRSEPMPIPIARSDPIFANFSPPAALPFHRSVRAAPQRHSAPPLNTLSSFIDLSSVYGADPERVRALRQFRHGLIRTSPHDLMQFNHQRMRNAPSNAAHFFLAGDHRANEHPVLTALHTLFVREHNRLSRELRRAYAAWSDEQLFQAARHINIARFQSIVYNEFIPAMTGATLPRYRGYSRKVHPAVSAVFATAAYRVGHTMVGGLIHRRARALAELPPLPLTASFFRPAVVLRHGIDVFLRGALHARAQEVDVQVHDALRNFLFAAVPQENGVDLAALNLQRARDHALPSYNELRRLAGRRRARAFADVTRDAAVRARLATAYGAVHRVEAWVGLLAEDHERGASMGPTMARLWRMEFARLRDGDRFFFARWRLFPWHMWWRVPTLRRMLLPARSAMRDVLLRNTDMTPSEVPRSPFFTWR